jgi:hypothetical protein
MKMPTRTRTTRTTRTKQSLEPVELRSRLKILKNQNSCKIIQNELMAAGKTRKFTGKSASRWLRYKQTLKTKSLVTGDLGFLTTFVVCGTNTQFKATLLSKPPWQGE